MRLTPTICACTAALLLCSCRTDLPDAATDGPDSLYTAAHIEKIALDQPEEALALLDEAEEKRLLSPFEISDLRCLVYHNGLSHYRTAYTHALKAYNDPEARNHPEKFLSLVAIMGEECHNNGDYPQSVDYCAEGLELAQQTGDRTAEASLHVTWGLNLLEMEQYDEAFRHIDLAVGILDGEARRDPCFRTWDELFYALGMKLNLLWEKDRYDEALAMRPDMEEALRGLELSEDTPEGLTDMRRAEMDVCYCCIAYTLGDNAEGDSLRRRVEANPYASTPDGEYLRIPCLLMAGRYDEALHYIRREKQLLQETTDTVSWDYIGSHLQMELEAWQGKGDWKQASRVQSGMMALTDTLRQRERQEDALELAEIYRSNEKDREIARQEESLRRLHIVLALMLQEENLRLRGELQRLHAEEDTPEEESGHPGDGDSTTAVRTLTDGDRALFERMHHEILRNRLYLRADFNKKELLKEFHIPANKFAPLFREFAGCSFTQYIQDCRLDYAVRLMREQPQWTLDAIAKESGMSNGAFYIQFQKKYGMKPSDYRRGM